MSTLTAVTAENFDAVVLKSEKPVLVDFWAEWCGPCKRLGPVLEELAAEHPDITIVKLNTEQQKELAAQYGIQSIPNMLIFRNGKVMGNILGLQTKQKLSAALDEILAKPDALGTAPKDFVEQQTALDAAKIEQQINDIADKQTRASPAFKAAVYAYNTLRAVTGGAMMYMLPNMPAKTLGAILLGTTAYAVYEKMTTSPEKLKQQTKEHLRAFFFHNGDMRVLNQVKNTNIRLMSFSAFNLPIGYALIKHSDNLPLPPTAQALGSVSILTGLFGLAVAGIALRGVAIEKRRALQKDTSSNPKI